MNTPTDAFNCFMGTELDILAIGNAGAYGEAMESQYNSFPRSATVAIDGNNIGLIRKRETLEDLCSHEHEVGWF